MPRSLPAISIVVIILLSLAGIGIAVNNYMEYQSRERIIHAFSSYYQGLARECYNRESVNCCLSSVSNMEAKKAVLIPGKGCPINTREDTLKCVSSFTWCEAQGDSASS